jgi:heme/copper-type cytochrome/quinol oxidase subunit 3
MTLPSQPEPGFNHHVSVWWGHTLTLLGEGVALAILVVTYFYIWKKSAAWPPAGTPLPDLGVATLDLAVLVSSILPMWHTARLALRHERPRVLGSWLLGCALFGITGAILRLMEFKTVNARWHSGAYAAIVWAILAVHFAHILAATLETLLIGIAMLRGPVNEWHFHDAMVNAVYWYFVALSWVALYAVVFLAPRLS